MTLLLCFVLKLTLSGSETCYQVQQVLTCTSKVTCSIFKEPLAVS